MAVLSKSSEALKTIAYLEVLCKLLNAENERPSGVSSFTVQILLLFDQPLKTSRKVQHNE